MMRYPIVIALVVWLIGAGILLMKSGQLLFEAHRLSGTLLWAGLAAVCGVILGIIKTRMVFKPFCIRNLKRINNLPSPKVWNAFSFIFWIMLLLMMTVGFTMSRYAQGNMILLCIVGAVDVMVGIGLLLSAPTFFKRTA